MAHVVVAIIDSGINPYHRQFRDDSPEAYRHPSTYLPGYPVNATALRLSLNETDLQTAIQKDCAILESVAANQWFWVPGTRIVGILLDEAFAREPVKCGPGERFQRVFDLVTAHGTGVAGRAAGADTSLCPTCKIVMHQAGQTTSSMHRIAKEPWIDLQSNSWAGYVHHQLPGNEGRGPHRLARLATERMVTFAASGNGERVRVDGPVDIEQDFFTGIPPHLRPAQGHAGVIVVGAHDNGQVILWPGTMPHVVADGWNTPTANQSSIATNRTMGGTSGATPFAAGVFARMVLEARTILKDSRTGLRDGSLAVAGPGATVPATGPLADGILSREEAESLYRASAAARPAEDLPFDGKLGCPPTNPCFTVSRGSDTMIQWSTVPEQVPAYYFIGYGQVGTRSLATSLRVLRGETPVPVRSDVDAFFDADTLIRRTLQE